MNHSKYANIATDAEITCMRFLIKCGYADTDDEAFRIVMSKTEFAKIMQHQYKLLKDKFSYVF